MLAQIFLGPPPSLSFLGGDVNQARTPSPDFIFLRLELSQAPAAVWSPRAPQKFDYDRALGNQIRQRKIALAICRSQREFGRRLAEAKCLGLVSHFPCLRASLSDRIIYNHTFPSCQKLIQVWDT
jgi:hypothetical protein